MNEFYLYKAIGFELQGRSEAAMAKAPVGQDGEPALARLIQDVYVGV